MAEEQQAPTVAASVTPPLSTEAEFAQDLKKRGFNDDEISRIRDITENARKFSQDLHMGK